MNPKSMLKYKQQIHAILDPKIEKTKMPDMTPRNVRKTTLGNLTKTATKVMIKSK